MSMESRKKEQPMDGMAIARARDRMQIGTRFNPSMLATVRCARGWSQTDLAEALNVSQALVSKWEAGLALPDESEEALMVSLLKVERDLLHVDRPRRLASMSDFYHRALSTARRTAVKAIHARCSIIDLQVDRLLELAKLPEDRIPNIDPQGSVESIDDIAAETRRVMGAGDGPILNLVGLMESCGALVIDRDLEVPDVDALCRWVPELPKLFFVNGSRPRDRIRFSLTHELGHTVMHFGRDCAPKQAESEADAFASAFLLPARDFLRDIRGHLSLADLAALKRKWRVSMAAIARRARTLGAIDERRYKSICIQMSQQGWRKDEPVKIDGETPRQFSMLLHAHLAAGYSRQELAKLLFVSLGDVERMLADCDAPKWEDQGVRLRLVR